MSDITKQCSVCKEYKLLSTFYKQTDGRYGVTSRCKPCLLESNKKYYNPDKQAEYTKKYITKNKEICSARFRSWRLYNLAYDAYRAKLYRTRKTKQLPMWADLLKIKDIYLNCPEGYHVDHIIPLKGKLVSGLHVETNLQYLTAKDNLAKRNKFNV